MDLKKHGIYNFRDKSWKTTSKRKKKICMVLICRVSIVSLMLQSRVQFADYLLRPLIAVLWISELCIRQLGLVELHLLS